MYLHTLRKSAGIRRRRRVGRGGKRGTTAGRGTKGQKSRAGRKLRPAQRDLIMRIPKLRGFANNPLREKALPLSLTALSGLTGVVDRRALEAAGIIRKRDSRRVKILSKGSITAALTIKGLSVSKTAKDKILKAGGTVES